MTTQREKSLAVAIERLSGRDLSRFIDFIGGDNGNYNTSAQTRYYLTKRLIDYAKAYGAEEQP